MKILQIAENLYLESGGPTKVVCELAEILNRKGLPTTVFSTASAKKWGNIRPLAAESKIFEQNFLSFFWPGHSVAFAEAIIKNIKNFDVVHVHEIWHYPHFIACLAARVAGIPYVVAPHGAMDRWCWRRRALAKNLFFNIVEKEIFSGAAAVQALTRAEAEDIKKRAPASRIVKIPNGINLDDFALMPQRDEFERNFGIAPQEKMILYLGRIDQKKGLDLLSLAFGAVSRKKNNARLVIAGPDNSEYAREIKKILENQKVADKTIFAGNLSGSAKMAALARADVFVLPSYSEGFSMAILEAMVCGIPSIFTQQCNFPEAGENKAALIIDCDQYQLAEAINIVFDSAETSAQIGANAKKLITRDFSLEAVSARMISLYRAIAKI